MAKSFSACLNHACGREFISKESCLEGSHQAAGWRLVQHHAKFLSRDWGAFAKPSGPSQSHQQQLRHQSNDQPNVLPGLDAQRPPQDRYRNSHPNLHVPLSRITKFDRVVDQSSDDSEQQPLAGTATEWSIISLSQSATPQNWTGSLRHAHFLSDSHSRRIPNTPQRAELPPAKEDK